MDATELTQPSYPAIIPAEAEANVRLLGKFLASLRRKAGLTQQELADILGMPRNTLAIYEMGTRRVTPGVQDRWVRAAQAVTIGRAVAADALPATHLDRPEFAEFLAGIRKLLEMEGAAGSEE